MDRSKSAGTDHSQWRYASGQGERCERTEYRVIARLARVEQEVAVPSYERSMADEVRDLSGKDREVSVSDGE
jgi:hypothetical protein